VTSAAPESGPRETGRIEAFSDGVFAVAITLLVLDIKVPPIPLAAGTTLGTALAAQWPTYLAFLTSFLTILILWINHHRIFGLIQRSDDRFMLLNGLLLIVVTLMPFTTSLVAAYLLHPQAHTAALVYSGTSVMLAVCFNLLWRYAAKNGRLLSPDHDRAVALGITRSYRFGPHTYIAAFIIGFFNVPICLGLCMALAVFFTIPPRKHAECAVTGSR
jgi:uncharacterized membrane protein